MHALGGKDHKLTKSQSLASPLIHDSKWASLPSREKSFVVDINMKPTSYCNIKRQIQLEICKNKQIRATLLIDGIKKALPQEEPNRVQMVYDFVVRVKLIPA